MAYSPLLSSVPEIYNNNSNHSKKQVHKMKNVHGLSKGAHVLWLLLFGVHNVRAISMNNVTRYTWIEDTQEPIAHSTHTPVLHPLPLVDRRCEDVAENVEAGAGVIAVTERQEDCNSMWTWNIQASPPQDGLVLQFNDVFLRRGCTLEVVTFAGSERVVQRKFTHERYGAYFAPLLVHKASASVVLTAPYDSYKFRFSTVNISYAAHNISQMPVPLRDTSVPSLSSPTYVCSGSVVIPAAFRCNGIQQCDSNEDEEGCEYTLKGCGDGWFPYRHFCLKMEFVTRFSFAPGRSHPTFPMEAASTCATKYGGFLALLPDQEGISLVGNMLRQSGHYSAVVGIRKVKPVSEKLRDLYR